MATTKVSVPTERKTPKWVIVLTFIGAAVLLIVGVLVLLAGREMWQHPGSPQVSHPTKATLEVVKMPVKVVKKHGQTHRRLGTVKRVKTVERLGQGGGRSEAVAMATLATGAALLLAGGFAARLTRIKLPGVEMDATAAFEAGSVAGAEVAKAAEAKGTSDVLQDKAKLVEAASITGAAMGVKPAPPLESIDDEKLQAAAEAAVQRVSDET